MSIRPRARGVLSLIESIDTIQVVYNIFDQTPPSCSQPRSTRRRDHRARAVRRGWLTGKIRPDSDFRNDYFEGDLLRQTYERVEAITDDLRIETDAIAGVALRFCLSQPAVSTVIAGMRSLINVPAQPCGRRRRFPRTDDAGDLRRHKWDRG